MKNIFQKLFIILVMLVIMGACYYCMKFKMYIPMFCLLSGVFTASMVLRAKEEKEEDDEYGKNNFFN